MPRIEVVESFLYTIKELKEQFPRAYQQAIEDNCDWNVSFDSWYENDFLLDPTDKEISKWKKDCRKLGLAPLIIQKGVNGNSGSALFDFKLKYFDFDRDSYILFDSIDCTWETLQVLKCLFGIPAYLHSFVDLYHSKTGMRRNNCSKYSAEIDGNYYESEVVLAVQKNEHCTLKEAQTRLDDYLNIDEVSEEFCERALHRISRDYEYLTSEEAIFEALESNEYEFELVDPTNADSDLANRRKQW